MSTGKFGKLLEFVSSLVSRSRRSLRAIPTRFAGPVKKACVPIEDVRLAAQGAAGLLVVSGLLEWGVMTPDVNATKALESIGARELMAWLLAIIVLACAVGLLTDAAVWREPMRAIEWHYAVAAQPIAVIALGLVPALYIAAVTVVLALIAVVAIVALVIVFLWYEMSSS